MVNEHFEDKQNEVSGLYRQTLINRTQMTLIFMIKYDFISGDPPDLRSIINEKVDFNSSKALVR